MPGRSQIESIVQQAEQLVRGQIRQGLQTKTRMPAVNPFAVQQEEQPNDVTHQEAAVSSEEVAAPVQPDLASFAADIKGFVQQTVEEGLKKQGMQSAALQATVQQLTEDVRAVEFGVQARLDEVKEELGAADTGDLKEDIQRAVVTAVGEQVSQLRGELQSHAREQDEYLRAEMSELRAQAAKEPQANDDIVAELSSMLQSQLAQQKEEMLAARQQDVSDSPSKRFDKTALLADMSNLLEQKMQAQQADVTSAQSEPLNKEALLADMSSLIEEKLRSQEAAVQELLAAKATGSGDDGHAGASHEKEALLQELSSMLADNMRTSGEKLQEDMARQLEEFQHRFDELEIVLAAHDPMTLSAEAMQEEASYDKLSHADVDSDVIQEESDAANPDATDLLDKVTGEISTAHNAQQEVPFQPTLPVDLLADAASVQSTMPMDLMAEQAAMNDKAGMADIADSENGTSVDEQRPVTGDLADNTPAPIDRPSPIDSDGCCSLSTNG